MSNQPRVLSQDQAALVCKNIGDQWRELIGKYDHDKYPADVYQAAKDARPALGSDQIEGILKWKWGHQNKTEYPEKQRRLVNDVQRLWKEFVNDYKGDQPKATYDFWTQRLGTERRFITRAFITHLMHPNAIPLIDQHNFRSLKHHLERVGVVTALPDSPRQWKHILLLKNFLDEVCAEMQKSEREVDQYMMMHGKMLKKQKPMGCE